MDGQFDLSNKIYSVLIIGVDASIPIARMTDIEEKLKRIRGIQDVIVVPGLKGAYCISR